MVKAQVEGFRCVRGRRGRTGDAKATGDSKYQLGIIYAHKWHLSWSRALFWLKRDLETTICNLRYCRLKLFVYGWLIPMLISWVLRKSTKHSSNLSQKKKNKCDKNNLKAVFCLLELLVYIQLVTCTRLSCNAQFSYWFPLFTLFVEDLWKHAASKFFDEIDIFSAKMALKRRRKIDRISWYRSFSLSRNKKKKNWKPSSGKSQETECYKRLILNNLSESQVFVAPQLLSYLPKRFTHLCRALYGDTTNTAAAN